MSLLKITPFKNTFRKLDCVVRVNFGEGVKKSVNPLEIE